MILISYRLHQRGRARISTVGSRDTEQSLLRTVLQRTAGVIIGSVIWWDGFILHGVHVHTVRSKDTKAKMVGNEMGT